MHGNFECGGEWYAWRRTCREWRKALDLAWWGCSQTTGLACVGQAPRKEKKTAGGHHFGVSLQDFVPVRLAFPPSPLPLTFFT